MSHQLSRLEAYHKLETPDYEPEDPTRIIEREICWLRVVCGFMAGLLIASLIWGVVFLRVMGG